MRWFRRRRRAGADTEALGSPAAVVGGRLRTVGVPYALPRDLEEINRLDFQHYMLRYALQGNYVAPIQHPRAILDVGCGTGRWAREVATVWPQSEVVGLDVMPPPADEQAAGKTGYDLRPANYRFMAGNILEGLPFEPNRFDFVHQRLLFIALPADRWPFVLSELIRVARPGGWVESVESGYPVGGGPAMDLLFTWGGELTARRGVDAGFGPKIPSILQQYGLVNMTARAIALPVGSYGGRVGTMAATDLLSAINGLGGLIVSHGIATQEVFQQTLQAARSDLDSGQFRCQVPFYVAYGQKAH
jgi:SAM-dependent methyltransferase